MKRLTMSPVLGMLALAVVLGAFLQSLDRKGMYPFIMQILSVAILCYAMIFTIPMGKFVDELYKPFIYLIPGSPLRKLYYASTAPMIPPAPALSTTLPCWPIRKNGWKTRTPLSVRIVGMRTVLTEDG